MKAQIFGRTDSLATNFNTYATLNDGSCLYDSANVSPINSWALPQTLNEASGLIIWDNYCKFEKLKKTPKIII